MLKLRGFQILGGFKVVVVDGPAIVGYFENSRQVSWNFWGLGSRYCWVQIWRLRVAMVLVAGVLTGVVVVCGGRYVPAFVVLCMACIWRGMRDREGYWLGVASFEFRRLLAIVCFNALRISGV